MGWSDGVSPAERAHNANCVKHLALHVISEVAMRLYEPNEALPFSAIRLFHPDVGVSVEPGKAEILSFWRGLLCLERSAAK